MKNLFLLLVILFTLSSFEKENPVDFAIISGKVLNPDGEPINIYSSDRNTKIVIPIDQNGNFKEKIKVNDAFFSVSQGRNNFNIFLESGAHLIIDFDVKDFKNTLKISGKGSEINNYLLAKDVKYNELRKERVEIFKLDEEAFKTRFNNFKAECIQLLESYNGISASFIQKEKRNIHYSYLNSLNSYQNAHAYYTNNKEFKTSEGFLNEINGINLESEEDFNFSREYISLINNQYFTRAKEIAKIESTDSRMEYLKLVSQSKNEKIRNYLAFQDASGSLKYLDDKEPYYNLFMSFSTDDENNTKITDLYNKCKNLKKGSPSPKFHNYENHAGGTTSLDDLKGKYIYIDVWATWCGPCRAEIPYLKETEKKYHGKNVTFLSLSIDAAKDHDKWVKMVTDEQLGGIQLLAENEWDSQFVKDYLINGIPHFILLDPQGNIVSYSAPRPSDSRLVELFDSLGI